jgi:hypothetical protein
VQHPLRLPRLSALFGTSVLVGVLMLVGSSTAQADSTQKMYERGCPLREVIVASQTTGHTQHGADGKTWDKGVKSNAGATTYTGQQYVVQASVWAATSIASAGTRCP